MLKDKRLGWRLYLRGIIRIEPAPRAAGPGRGAERGWGRDVLLAVTGLGPRGGSELQVILAEVWSLGLWLLTGPGHSGPGLSLAGVASWEILHELVQFFIICLFQEVPDLRWGDGKGGGWKGRIKRGRQEKARGRERKALTVKEVKKVQPSQRSPEGPGVAWTAPKALATVLGTGEILLSL